MNAVLILRPVSENENVATQPEIWSTPIHQISFQKNNCGVNRNNNNNE